MSRKRSKLLILTQIIDTEDSMLGFFHTWVEEFAKHFEKITVVCLKEGKHDLPGNVQVHSLGKEKGASKLTQLFRFYRYVWKYRREYDAVYVHMNQEYVLLGGLLWRVLGKYVTMWRNHFAGTLLTDVAALLCHKVFCTSRYSYTAKYKKTVLMPVGVSEQMFKPLSEVVRVPHSILSLVRISPAKKIEQLIDALALLKARGIPFTATICGKAIEEHRTYEQSLHTRVLKKRLEGRVFFTNSIPYAEVPTLFSRYDIVVNQSPSGMYDKTIFEAMMCEAFALSCNENLRGEVDDVFLFKEDNVEDLSDKLEKLLMLPDRARSECAHTLSKYARENHSLQHLAKRLHIELSK